jgi:CRP-like cAMP-binding protein
MSGAIAMMGKHATPLSRRLERYYRISPTEARKLDEVEHLEVREHSRRDILADGARNESFIVVQSGWAYRYRMTRENKRQILNFLVPGDIVNPDAIAVFRTDHCIRTLTDVTYRCIRKESLSRLLLDCPAVTAALWWCNAQEKGMLQAQIVRLGRQSAVQRVGHMLLELHRRLSLVQEVELESNSFLLPLTQTDLADALGLSSVHVSRVLTELRKERLLRRVANSIELLRPKELAQKSGFDLSHLHLDSSFANSVWN